jgi:H/ACA ribonucleoprotein complex subunit 1
VLKVELEDVPYFNAPIFLENKSQIGKIDEIFGTLRDYSVSVKLSDNMNASSFVPKQKLFIDPAKLLPLQRFLPQPPKPKGIGKKKKGDKAPGGAAGGGGSFGGRGGSKLTLLMKRRQVEKVVSCYLIH